MEEKNESIAKAELEEIKEGEKVEENGEEQDENLSFVNLCTNDQLSEEDKNSEGCEGKDNLFKSDENVGEEKDKVDKLGVEEAEDEEKERKISLCEIVSQNNYSDSEDVGLIPGAEPDFEEEKKEGEEKRGEEEKGEEEEKGGNLDKDAAEGVLSGFQSLGGSAVEVKQETGEEEKKEEEKEEGSGFEKIEKPDLENVFKNPFNEHYELLKKEDKKQDGGEGEKERKKPKLRRIETKGSEDSLIANLKDEDEDVEEAKEEAKVGEEQTEEVEGEPEHENVQPISFNDDGIEIQRRDTGDKEAKETTESQIELDNHGQIFNPEPENTQEDPQNTNKGTSDPGYSFGFPEINVTSPKKEPNVYPQQDEIVEEMEPEEEEPDNAFKFVFSKDQDGDNNDNAEDEEPEEPAVLESGDEQEQEEDKQAPNNKDKEIFDDSFGAKQNEESNENNLEDQEDGVDFTEREIKLSSGSKKDKNSPMNNKADGNTLGFNSLIKITTPSQRELVLAEDFVEFDEAKKLALSSYQNSRKDLNESDIKLEEKEVKIDIKTPERNHDLEQDSESLNDSSGISMMLPKIGKAKKSAFNSDNTEQLNLELHKLKAKQLIDDKTRFISSEQSPRNHMDQGMVHEAELVKSEVIDVKDLGDHKDIEVDIPSKKDVNKIIAKQMAESAEKTACEEPKFDLNLNKKQPQGVKNDAFGDYKTPKKDPSDMDPRDNFQSHRQDRSPNAFSDRAYHTETHRNIERTPEMFKKLSLDEKKRLYKEKLFRKKQLVEELRQINREINALGRDVNPKQTGYRKFKSKYAARRARRVGSLERIPSHKVNFKKNKRNFAGFGDSEVGFL